MEQALDVYATPPSAEEPTICMDEAAKQLLTGVDEPLPAAPGQPPREDYHYERNGVQAILMSFDPEPQLAARQLPREPHARRLGAGGAAAAG